MKYFIVLSLFIFGGFGFFSCSKKAELPLPISEKTVSTQLQNTKWEVVQVGLSSTSLSIQEENNERTIPCTSSIIHWLEENTVFDDFTTEILQENKGMILDFGTQLSTANGVAEFSANSKGFPSSMMPLQNMIYSVKSLPSESSIIYFVVKGQTNFGFESAAVVEKEYFFQVCGVDDDIMLVVSDFTINNQSVAWKLKKVA